jgi:hypothetical protein
MTDMTHSTSVHKSFGILLVASPKLRLSILLSLRMLSPTIGPTYVVLTVDSTYRELDPPPSLFPMATSISLAGVVSHNVLSAIFESIDPTKLKYLRLNNVQTFSDMDTILSALNEEEIDAHRRRRAGGAYGWLNHLRGRCASLRTFHYLTSGEFVDMSNDVFSPDWPEQVTNERYRYAEVAEFIEYIKPFIRELLFEHGPDIQYFGYNPGKHTDRAFQGPNHDAPLPMDTYFNAYIYPVLTSGTWPKLQKITLRGIGHWKPLDLWGENATQEEIRYLHRKTVDFRDRAEMIWESVGAPRVDVCIEAEASKPFYRFQADRTTRR